MLQAIERLRDFLGCAFALGASPKAAGTIFWKETKNLRARLRLEAYHPAMIYRIETIYGPLYFRDNSGDITNLVQLFYRNAYRIGKLRHEGAILDIGANIGLAAALYGYYNPDQTIYCFEPLEDNAALIELNCCRARVQRTALGGRSGRVRLGVDPFHMMASSIPCEWQTRAMEFDLMTVDEFASANNLAEVAVMKIDTEGMEVEILRGSRKTLRQTRQVAMESHSPSLHKASIEHLTEAGFFIDSESLSDRTGLILASRR